MSSVKGKIERNLKHTYSILSARSTKTIKKQRERFMVELVNISSLFFMLLSVYWPDYIIQTINFHSLRKMQTFCPLGDAIRPKAKQTEIHHPRCSQGCQKEMQRKQPWIWLNKQQAKKCFSFLFVVFFFIWGHTNTHKNLKIIGIMN